MLLRLQEVPPTNVQVKVTALLLQRRPRGLFEKQWVGLLQQVANAGHKLYRLQGEALQQDWVAGLELEGARSFVPNLENRAPLKVLVLYGSLRQRSYSQLLAFEFARRACRPRCSAGLTAIAGANLRAVLLLKRQGELAGAQDPGQLGRRCARVRPRGPPHEGRQVGGARQGAGAARPEPVVRGAR